MKNIFKSILTFVLLLPCLLLLSACGEVKDLNGKTLTFSKVEVTGSLDKADYEDQYKSVSYKFEENTFTHIDGVVEVVYSYKLENGKVYLKSDDEDEYSKTAHAEISGKYMIITDELEDGTVKIYFEIK